MTRPGWRGQRADPAQCLSVPARRARRQICRAERGATSTASTVPRPAMSRCGPASPSRRGWSGRRTRLPASRRSAPFRARAPTLLAAAGRMRGEDAARLVAARLFADLFGRASRRAEGPQRVGGRCRLGPLRAFLATRPRRRSTHAQSAAGWGRRRIEGKALSVLRLAKASATYAGGADYIAWKINRHAGTEFELKPWQSRHPLLAALSLLPRLLQSGAIR